ncbi:MAG TPA: glycoside hydrolase family 2 TIM barrel-domain containing protein [Solirubrobacteraceae bacterium]|nr:glycoside hydrolase family 2 TIM barrel-domain containing protein [Solirubrobacteraceae bacterium]
MRLAIGLTLLALVAPAAAQAADVPASKTFSQDGPEGRFLMEGDWLFRLDAADRGVRSRYYRQRSTSGWSTVKVPHAWNVGDHSIASMNGSVGWYRKDFELPSASAALDWAVRFESVNYRSTVWLNGRRVGRNAGAFLPFSVLLDRVSRRGVNRLVIRVDSRRTTTDFPPGRTSRRTRLPTGGWWNYGGILREVYLQRIDTMELETGIVNPRLGCAACDSTVVMETRVRNVSRRARRATVTGTFGARRVRLGSARIAPNGTEDFRGSVKIADPRLWSPADPYLYPASIEVRVGGRLVGRWKVSTGIRSVKVSGGRLFLNGRPLTIRGVGLHEDSESQGFAVDNAWRRWLVDRAKELGASMLRTHYPMHPYIHELADREGLLIWSEIPVYAHKSSVIDDITGPAIDLLRKNIEVNASHPSVLIWSIANELSSKPGPTQGTYIRRAKRAARELDPTRPVGLAVAGYPGAGCQARYGPLDVVGVNDYFGWYPGPSGTLFDRGRLSPYLDSLRRCYPSDAIMVTEFGAEANRAGSVEDKGTYAFQQDFVNYHLSVFATKPWLSGALYWALNEFRVRPEWDGGNPFSTPPIHQKALMHYDGTLKPAWTDVQGWFHAVSQ